MVMVEQHCEVFNASELDILRMLRMINFMLCIFHNIKKDRGKKRQKEKEVPKVLKSLKLKLLQYIEQNQFRRTLLST